MKKIVTFMALAIVLLSCSNDDDKTEEEFFNLKVGNQWVYKRYDVNSQGVENYRGKTDTVRVVGVESIDGKDFYRLTHTDNQILDIELLRVDEAGHLVSTSGFVVHPGTDKDFTDARVILDDHGTMNYTLKNTYKATIEGENYEVYPYSGYFTSSPQYSLPEGEGALELYSKDIGFVVRRYRYKK